MVTPHLNKIFSDETGELYGVVESDGRFFIHSNLYFPSQLSTVKHYEDILWVLEQELKSKGLTEYYTMADSVSGFRFNEHMGFRTVYEVWDNKYEVMKKDIV